MKVFTRFIIIIFICLLACRAGAQEENCAPGFGVELNAMGGKIIRHSDKFTSPIPRISTALDVNFIWQTCGRKEWHQRRNFPLIGVGITYTDYGNNLVYGRCVGIYPNLQIPLVRGRHMEWTFRFGNGLAYVTKRHLSGGPTDTANSAVSTNLNDYAVFMTDLRVDVDKHWQVQVGANFTHISNASYYQPNLGVNMLGAHVGVRYFPVTCHPKRVERDLPKLKNRWLAQARVSISYKEARAAGNPIKPAYLAAAYVSRRWLGKNKVYAGVDYAYHEDIYAFLKNYGVHEGKERQHAWDGGVFVGNEFLVGRLGLMVQVGMYYHQTFLKYDDLYQKIGGNYYVYRAERGVVKEVFLSALLLTHEIKAQLAEFGVGVGF